MAPRRTIALYRMPKVPYYLHCLSVLIFGFAVGCSRTNFPCAAPAKLQSAQAYDLCFLKNQTDDIAAPSIQDCYAKLIKLSDTCDSRIEIKKERCQILSKSDESVKLMPIENCVSSMATEGYLVKGCEYPFTLECTNKISAIAR